MSKAINLESFIKAVWAAGDLATKKGIAVEMINASHAKAETKEKALRDLQSMVSTKKVDFFVTNYSFSGSGMKVI
jgi:hypothetical protein